MNPQITTGTEDPVGIASDLLADVFQYDPSIRYCLSSLDSKKYREAFFNVLLALAVSENATTEEAEGFRSCGVIVPSTESQGTSTLKQRLSSAGLEGCLVGFVYSWSLCDSHPYIGTLLCKGEKHYHIFFLGTPTVERGKSLCSAIIRHYQSIASRKMLPVYLEAGIKYCCSLYESLGLTIVSEALIGEGKAAADGPLLECGPGFRMWGMIWRP